MIRLRRRGSALAAIGGIAVIAGCGEPEKVRADAVVALATAPARPIVVDPEIGAFYAERGHRPLWVAAGALRPEAAVLVRTFAAAKEHGLDPDDYGASELASAADAARGGDRNARARVELLLSRGLTRYVKDLRRPGDASQMLYTEDGLAPEAPSPKALLDGAAAAPSLGEYLAELQRMNPLYDSLRRGYRRLRASTKKLPPAEEALILANLRRARAIPGHHRRYIIVDAASARLWMIDGARVRGPMRTVVGKPDMETPALAGFIRYTALNPYWNMPPDLAQGRAKRVLREGSGFLKRENIQILSDWGAAPRVISPAQVDWRAVSAGRKDLRMRQLPGGGNVMGAIKFMMPNRLGIYLHDTPDKSLFARADRRLSSGCVRVADAQLLSRWLFGGKAPRPSGSAPEQRVDLPEPVPVYITYLTVLPDPAKGIAFQADPYRRDQALFARMEEKAGRRSRVLLGRSAVAG